jgi:NAD(P)H-dependent FMN reductase
MSRLKIAVIIGSTRDSRFGPKPAQWVFELAQKREQLDVELVDLKECDLPFFNEKATNLWMPSEDPKAIAWQTKIGRFERLHCRNSGIQPIDARVT